MTGRPPPLSYGGSPKPLVAMAAVGLAGRGGARRAHRLVVRRAGTMGARGCCPGRDGHEARVGEDALSQVLLAVPRREGGRRGIRRLASPSEAPQLHDRQVQDSNDSQRSAPDARGPRQHHPARHAVHVDARLARPLRPGSLGSRRLHHHVLTRILQTRRTPPSQFRSPAHRDLRRSRSSWGRSSTSRTAASRCHGSLGRGDGPSAPTLVDDWGQPIRPADLTQSWTFRGGSSREDIFRTMSTGLNGTPMPSYLDALKEEQRWAITDYHRVHLGQRRAGLHQPRRREARRRSDRPGQGNRELRIRPCRALSDHRTSHRARPGLPSSHDVRDRAGGLRCGVDRAAGSMARHERAEDRKERPVAAGASRRRGGGRRRPADASATPGCPPELQRRRGASGARRKPPRPLPRGAAAASRLGAAPQGPVRGGTGAGRQASEFSDAVAVQIPSQVPTGARKPYFIFGDSQNSVDLWFFDLARPAPLQFSGKGSAEIAPNDTGDVTGVASYDQGEWSVIFKRPLRASSGATFSPGQFMPIAFSVWDGFSRERGNRRGLSVWYSLYLGPEATPSVVGPMIQTALLILVFELVVIGWVRWRYRAREDRRLGDQPTEPAAGGA